MRYLVPLFCLLALLLAAAPAQAHEGPPYPIIVDRETGPCMLSVWADPDVGIGTFYFILEPLPGGSIPEDIKVEIGVQPLTGRLPEALHRAERESVRGRTQFKAEVPFDAEERWRVRVVIESRDADEVWSTVGVSENIIEASWLALVDSVEYKLFKDNGEVGEHASGELHAVELTASSNQ